jgi:uncharacterized protein
MDEPAALIVFARAPLPGRTKTRLIPALGEQGAADLYRCFLLDTLAGAAALGPRVIVAGDEAEHLRALRDLVATVAPRAELVAQFGDDLGARMLNAFRLALGASRHAVIVGTDAPTLPRSRLREAFALAPRRDLVLGPCFDGGYYLAGMHAAQPRLFEGMSWGGPTVLVDTLARARELGLEVSLLDPWYDVDRPEDLVVLRRHLTALALAGQELPCPLTWEFLRAHPEAGR